jgi:hypothetical protein
VDRQTASRALLHHLVGIGIGARRLVFLCLAMRLERAGSRRLERRGLGRERRGLGRLAPRRQTQRNSTQLNEILDGPTGA